MRRWRSTWLLLLAFGVVACGAPAPPTGSLSVAITGLPAGVAAATQVSGPGGSTQLVTASRVLTGLAPGTYVVTAAAVDDGHPIVPAVYDANVATPTVDVAANGTAIAAVAHAWRAPTGMGWISLADEGESVATLSGYAAAQFESDGNPVPAVAIDHAPEYWDGIAFDGDGNAWVARYGPTSQVVRFRAADLVAGGTRTPDVVLGSSGMTVWHGPAGIAFDDDGALWVTGNLSNTIVKFAPAQLAASGSPAPQVVISASGGSLQAPVGLAFDAAGNLWVANVASGTLVRFSPAQLATSGAPVPSVTLSAAGGRLNGAFGIAFDADGNLWASALTYGVLRYAPAQQAATGSPVPAASLTGIGRPKGLAFDHRGDLWVHRNEGTTESLVRIADPGSLPADSVAVPATTIGIDHEVDGGFLSFLPPAPGVPIRTP